MERSARKRSGFGGARCGWPLTEHRVAKLAVGVLFACGLGLLGTTCSTVDPPGTSLEIPGLQHPVRVAFDKFGVPHIVAQDDLDAVRVQGYLHARDRFWQMDLTRRQVSGDLAELLGPGALGSDIQMRTLGLRRAAVRSEALLDPHEREVLQAYADGVNAFLATQPLPPEYAQLELTQARPWTVVDTLAIAKAIAASLSLDIDVGPLQQLQAYCAAGAAANPPFDGAKLLLEDVRRLAPMDPVSTVPDADGTEFFLPGPSFSIDCGQLTQLAAAAERVRKKAEATPFLAAVMHRSERQIGSNEWGVTAEWSANGHPMIANDPHLALDAPSTFYENHLIVENDPVSGPMNVSGVSFPGAPFVILGQNERITWGATTNPMDVSDTFRDHVVHTSDPRCQPWSLCIETEGQLYPIELSVESYFVNFPGDGVLDNVQEAGSLVPFEQRFVLTVPFRSFGPIIDIDDPGVITGAVPDTHALVLQFAGFHGTRLIRAFRIWNRAHSVAEFRQGLKYFDFGSQNWAVADADGHLAYFTSGELPLRRDLEAGQVVGFPPFLIRDGSGPNNWIPDPDPAEGQALPFKILPPEEMPHTIDPRSGFFANANNDPAGTTLDNDPLNQRRLGNPQAIYYLNPGYDEGLRAGRITRLLLGKIRLGEKITQEDLQRFQANTQQLDAELMVPFLVGAFENAKQPGAPAELKALAEDPEVAEAARRLAAWDFSTPTGIPEGWDASDPPGVRRAQVPDAEVAASIAATIYNVWRAKLIRNVIDTRLAALGVPGVGSGDALKALHHLLIQKPFTGVGASGVDFFPQPAGLAPEDRRDVTLLQALRDALDALASDAFQEAFGHSHDQNDYRWGRLHRITFDHKLGAPFSIPPAAGFADLDPLLPGIPRDGGYEVVNASGFSARADSSNAFRFGGGPVRRYVGAAGAGEDPQALVRGFNVIPGGSSGVFDDPLYASQLRLWLTADYHPVPMRGRALGAATVRVERFLPPGS